MAFGQLSLKGRALRLLSQREYSRSELAAKLSQHVSIDDAAADLAQVDQTVEELVQLGLVSDKRTADTVVHAKGRRYGVVKIRQVLQSKGIPEPLILDALVTARSGEFEAAKQLWLHRFGTPATDAKGHARQYRFLSGRGFSPDTVRRVLDARSTNGET